MPDIPLDTLVIVGLVLASLIGRITDHRPGRVVMETVFGGRRIVDMLVGEQLPRIC